MSYILEALRRAEAERKRGAVPGLDSQHRIDPEPAMPSHRSPAPLWWAMGLLLGLALPGLAYWWGRQTPVDTPPAAQQHPPRPPALPTPAAQEPPLAAPIAQAPASAPQSPPAPTAVPPSPAPAAPATSPPPTPRAPRPAPQAAAPAAPRPPSEPRPPAPAAALQPEPAAPPAALHTAQPPLAPQQPAPPAAAAAQRPAPSAPAPRLQDLPETVRSALPPLSLGGLIYATTPSERIVIVNGQPYREGDSVGPELVVEHIQPRAAVLRWRQQRFQLTY
ncbi:MAG: hypothetical protein KatS3mg122_1223 [Caldimonas sp.]|uniref:general secretion pathway protein GspB n=1 Tax=Caldimonas taiwanensis TaxID=307483 RepID=UPI0007805FAF|nr:general secretion pathway protein GspB [Caldimonas taiwanensis]GIX23992.1 MAG: hypothetical protein KatS3mg122_1223 [Caldimonas sp.]